jgi:nicotinate-nucleotide pyrophosphorylase (carboxylating)
VKNSIAVLPPFLLLDRHLQDWLIEDIGRGDRTTQALAESQQTRQAYWIAKEKGCIAGLPIAQRVFQLLDANIQQTDAIAEGAEVEPGDVICRWDGRLAALLMGERVALNLVMRLSGIATATRQFVECLDGLPTQFVDTRKVTPGLRLLEKYASQVGGAQNHRFGLDDAVMLKDNHIAAAGGIAAAIAQVRASAPYPLTIEVETESLAQVEDALQQSADLIMLDNMPLDLMREAVQLIRKTNSSVKIEASGNVRVETLRAIAQTGVDYISSSAPITRSSWLDISMRMV